MSNKLPQTPARGKDSFLKSMDSIIFAVKTGKTPCRTPTNVTSGESEGTVKRRLSHTPQTLNIGSTVRKLVAPSPGNSIEKTKTISAPEGKCFEKEQIPREKSIKTENQKAVGTQKVDSVAMLSNQEVVSASGTVEKWGKTPSGVTLISETGSKVRQNERDDENTKSVLCNSSSDKSAAKIHKDLDGSVAKDSEDKKKHSVSPNKAVVRVEEVGKDKVITSCAKPKFKSTKDGEVKTNLVNTPAEKPSVTIPKHKVMGDVDSGNIASSVDIEQEQRKRSSLVSREKEKLEDKIELIGTRAQIVTPVREVKDTSLSKRVQTKGTLKEKKNLSKENLTTSNNGNLTSSGNISEKKREKKSVSPKKIEVKVQKSVTDKTEKMKEQSQLVTLVSDAERYSGKDTPASEDKFPVDNITDSTSLKLTDSDVVDKETINASASKGKGVSKKKSPRSRKSQVADLADGSAHPESLKSKISKKVDVSVDNGNLLNELAEKPSATIPKHKETSDVDNGNMASSVKIEQKQRKRTSTVPKEKEKQIQKGVKDKIEMIGTQTQVVTPVSEVTDKSLSERVQTKDTSKEKWNLSKENLTTSDSGSLTSSGNISQKKREKKPVSPKKIKVKVQKSVTDKTEKMEEQSQVVTLVSDAERYSGKDTPASKDKFAVDNITDSTSLILTDSDVVDKETINASASKDKVVSQKKSPRSRKSYVADLADGSAHPESLKSKILKKVDVSVDNGNLLNEPAEKPSATIRKHKVTSDVASGKMASSVKIKQRKRTSTVPKEKEKQIQKGVKDRVEMIGTQTQVVTPVSEVTDKSLSERVQTKDTSKENLTTSDSGSLSSGGNISQMKREKKPVSPKKIEVKVQKSVTDKTEKMEEQSQVVTLVSDAERYSGKDTPASKDKFAVDNITDSKSLKLTDSDVVDKETISASASKDKVVSQKKSPRSRKNQVADLADGSAHSESLKSKTSKKVDVSVDNGKDLAVVRLSKLGADHINLLQNNAAEISFIAPSLESKLRPSPSTKSTPVTSKRRGKKTTEKTEEQPLNVPKAVVDDDSMSGGKVKDFQPSASSTPVSTVRRRKKKEVNKLSPTEKKDLSLKEAEAEMGGIIAADISKIDNSDVSSEMKVSCKLLPSKRGRKKKQKEDKEIEEKKQKLEKSKSKSKKEMMVTECSIKLFDEKKIDKVKSKFLGNQVGETKCKETSALGQDASGIHCRLFDKDFEKTSEENSDKTGPSDSVSNTAKISEGSLQQEVSVSLRRLDLIPDKGNSVISKSITQTPNESNKSMTNGQTLDSCSTKNAALEESVGKKKRGKKPKNRNNVQKEESVITKTAELMHDSTVPENSCNENLKIGGGTPTPKVGYTGKKPGRKKKITTQQVDASVESQLGDSVLSNLGKRKRSEETDVCGTGDNTAVKKRKYQQEAASSEQPMNIEEEEEILEETEEISVKVEDQVKVEGTPGRSKRAAALRAKQAWSEESVIGNGNDHLVTYFRPNDPLPVSDDFLSEVKTKLMGNTDKEKTLSCPFNDCGKPYWNYHSLMYHLKHCRKGLRGTVYNGYECSQCKYRQKSEKAMKKHVQEHMKSAKKARRALLDVEGGMSDLDDDRDVDWKEGSQSAHDEQEEEEESEGVDSDISESETFEPKKGRRKKGVIGKPGFQILNKTENRSKYMDAAYFLKNFNPDLSTVSLNKMPEILESSFSWTLDFVMKHQRKRLYPDMVYGPEEITVVTDRERARFSSKEPVSVEFSAHSSKSKRDSQLKLNMFESHISDFSATTTVNVGGPVWALGWCPTPLAKTETSQILALYCHTEASQQHKIHTVKQGQTTIQIWDCGKLDSKCHCSPSLAYYILLQMGAVWQMTWCPTGCWNIDDQGSDSSKKVGRLGLLALACSAGHVEILSVPTPAYVQSLCRSDSKEPIVIELKSKWRLRQQFRGEPKANCLCIDWQWAGECCRLVAGFSDGSVSLWNLNSSSPLLKRQATDGATEWLPYRTFLPHRDAIMSVSFCPRVPHYLATASLDKDMKILDVRSPDQAVDVITRIRATSLVVPVNWMLWITSYDDSLMFGRNSSYAAECGYLERGGLNLTSFKSTVRGQSFSHWLNTIAMATTGGEVFLNYLHFGLYVTKLKKSIIQRRLILYSCSPVNYSVVNTTEAKEASEDPRTPSEEVSSRQNQTQTTLQARENSTATEKTMQGILFKDAKLLENKDISKPCGEGNVDCFLTHKALHTYINRVSWNPNLGSHTWLASATNGGLLRLHRVSALETSGMRKAQQHYIQKQMKR